MADQTTEQALAEIWRLFKETNAMFKETDAKFKETDAKFKETDAKFAETDARLDRGFAATNAEIARTSANLQKLEGLFGNQWGRLIESLVQPGILNLFQQRGHDVRGLHQRSQMRVNGSVMEIDIILEDETEVIPIEVKSTFSVDDVNDFLVDLADFTRFFPKYATYRIYGAIAGLDVPADVARHAYRRGLFVITVSGSDMVQILNDTKFRPRDFGLSEQAQ